MARHVSLIIALLALIVLFASPSQAYKKFPCPKLNCKNSKGVKGAGYLSTHPASTPVKVSKVNTPGDCYKECKKIHGCTHWQLVQSSGADICFFYSKVSTTCVDSLSTSVDASTYSTSNFIGCVPHARKHKKP